LKRQLLTILLAVMLTGCAALPDLPLDYALDDSRPEGLAFVSLTLAGKQLSQISSFEYQIRELPPADQDAVVTRPHFGSAKQHAKWVASGHGSQPGLWKAVVSGPGSSEPLNVLENGKAMGRLVALHLPPGNYEFHAWKLIERNPPYGEIEYGPKQPLSYRFSVKRGEAVYLGRLSLQLGERNTQKVAAEDRHESDLAIIKDKYPSLGRGAISVRALGS
jgi:hypothetical protein